MKAEGQCFHIEVCKRFNQSDAAIRCWCTDVFACAGLSWGDRLSPSPSSDACSWRSSTPSPPLSEGGSTSTFWSQVTTDEGIVIDEYDELPRKKKVSTSPARNGSFKLPILFLPVLTDLRFLLLEPE